MAADAGRTVLLQQARERGRVRLIVGLRDAFVAETRARGACRRRATGTVRYRSASRARGAWAPADARKIRLFDDHSLHGARGRCGDARGAAGGPAHRQCPGGPGRPAHARRERAPDQGRPGGRARLHRCRPDRGDPRYRRRQGPPDAQGQGGVRGLLLDHGPGAVGLAVPRRRAELDCRGLWEAVPSQPTGLLSRHPCRLDRRRQHRQPQGRRARRHDHRDPGVQQFRRHHTAPTPPTSSGVSSGSMPCATPSRSRRRT